MDGSATLTMVMSTTMSRNPMQSTISDGQRVLVVMPLMTCMPFTTHRSGDEFQGRLRSEALDEDRKDHPGLRPGTRARRGYHRVHGASPAGRPRARRRSVDRERQPGAARPDRALRAV